jgi:hypothetical protein
LTTRQRPDVEALLRARRARDPAPSPSRGFRGFGPQRRQTRSSGSVFRLWWSTQTKTTINQITASGKRTMRPTVARVARQLRLHVQLPILPVDESTRSCRRSVAVL